jgi:hypothetical protein
MLTKLTAAASRAREAEGSRQIPTQKIFFRANALTKICIPSFYFLLDKL